MDFPGVALVTGAASGIGRQTSILYAREGCNKISICDLNEKELKITEGLIREANKHAQIVAFVCDIADESSVQKMIDGTVEQLGRIDYCANVAGITVLGSHTAEISTTFFDRDNGINLRGLFFCERAELQVMLKQEPLKHKYSKYLSRGSIVNISSMAGLVGKPEIPIYTSSKHGVIGLSKADGMYYGKHLIRVNAVCPGAIDTPILANSGNAPSTQPIQSSTNMNNALGRWGDPEEVAESIVWISSSRANYITATVLAINGGQVGA